MIVLDSSAWIEVLTKGRNAEAFYEALKHPDRVLVPSLCLYEVFRWVDKQFGREEAEIQLSGMERCLVVSLDEELAKASARFSWEHKLAMADCIIYTTAQSLGAELWTQDADFEGLPGVKYLPKKKKA